MSNDKKSVLSARVFTTSVKPSWSEEKTKDFLASMEGVAKVYVVKHDKDKNEDNSPIEEHTHILLIYETPRRISTIANALGLEANFVEVVHNTKAMLKYLTHIGSTTKHLYAPSEVQTNSTPYEEVIQGLELSDHDILQAVLNGDELSLIGQVSPHRIALFQRLAHNRLLNNQTALLQTLREQNANLIATVEKMSDNVNRIEMYFTQMVQGLGQVGEQTKTAITRIAEEIKRARLKVK